MLHIFQGENLLFSPENNARFLFDIENKNLSYMSSTQVFVSYLTLPLVWVPNGVNSIVDIVGDFCTPRVHE
jgi:hypothetical protein